MMIPLYINLVREHWDYCCNMWNSHYV